MNNAIESNIEMAVKSAVSIWNAHNPNSPAKYNRQQVAFNAAMELRKNGIEIDTVEVHAFFVDTVTNNI